MRKITALLSVALLIGCKDPKASFELKGQLDVPAPPRYQIIINSQEWSGANAEAFLLDTQKGRVWGYTRFVPSIEMGKRPIEERFYPIRIIDDDGELGFTTEQYDHFLKWVESKENAREQEKLDAQIEAKVRELDEIDKKADRIPITVTPAPSPTATPIYR